MTGTNFVETYIPFEGFYESTYSNLVQDYIEYETSNLPLEVSQELYDSFYEHANFYEMYKVISILYTKSLNLLIREECDGLEVELYFKELNRPREYNFHTDRILCKIDFKNVQKLFDILDKNILRDVIKRRFTSYDGFISHYSNRLDDWLAKDLVKWDSIEIETLFKALIKQFDLEYKLNAYDLLESDRCNGVIDNIVEKYTDKKFFDLLDKYKEQQE